MVQSEYTMSLVNKNLVYTNFNVLKNGTLLSATRKIGSEGGVPLLFIKRSEVGVALLFLTSSGSGAAL